MPGPAPLTIRKGVEGKVIRRGTESNPGWVEVTMPFLNPPRREWVPFSKLEIGTDYKYNEVHVYIPDPVVRASQVLNQGNTTKDPLRRALEQLAVAFRDNIALCPWFPPWFIDRLKVDDQRRNLVDAIYVGMIPAVRSVLNRPNFTIRQLMQALVPINPNDTRPCVYTIIYWNFKNGDSKPRQYMGKAKIPGQRDAEHVRESERDRSKKSVHYSAAKNARNRIMGVVSYIDEYHARAVAEQFFVNLFQCHCSNVFAQSTTLQTRSDGTTPHGELDDASDSAAKYAMDKEQATKLTRIADAALRSVGFPAGSSRDTYGAGDGLNWNAPVAEMFNREKIIWVRQAFINQNLDCYRRQPTKVRENAKYTKHVWIAGETKSKSTLGGTGGGNFFPSLPIDMQNVPEGSWVYPIIEMTRDGSPHHLNFTRLPSVGPWADWDKARSWALKLEWEDSDGLWQSCYLAASRVFEMRARATNAAYITHEPGAYNTYAHGIAIYRYLNQIDVQQLGRPNWQYDYGLARIKRQYFDFRTQTLRVQEEHPDPLNIVFCAPRDHPSRMVIKYLRAGLNAGGRFGEVDRPSRKVRKPLYACDQCYLMNVKDRYQDVYEVSLDVFLFGVFTDSLHRDGSMCTGRETLLRARGAATIIMVRVLTTTSAHAAETWGGSALSLVPSKIVRSMIPECGLSWLDLQVAESSW